MKLYHVSHFDSLTMLEPHQPRFSPFFGLFLAPFDRVAYWQNHLAEDGPFPSFVYEVDVPDDVIIYVDEPCSRTPTWNLAEYEYNRVPNPHLTQMWIKVPLPCKLIESSRI